MSREPMSPARTEPTAAHFRIARRLEELRQTHALGCVMADVVAMVLAEELPTAPSAAEAANAIMREALETMAMVVSWPGYRYQQEAKNALARVKELSNG